jgi:RNA polymerase sigma-70 factor (ECF subfamily)
MWGMRGARQFFFMRPGYSMVTRTDRQGRFIELLNENQGRLFGYLYAHVLNMADTEDLYQQVALKLWEKFDQFVPGTDFGSWGIRVAEFTIKNFLRGKRRSKVFFSEDVMQRIVDRQSARSHEMVAARTEALQGCLKRLPKQDRDLIESCYSGDAKIKDVAESGGRSAGAVYTALCRIRQVLLACIERTIAAESRS